MALRHGFGLCLPSNPGGFAVSVNTGAPAGGWTPEQLPGIIDFGKWNDLSRLKQPDGTTAVASVNDPVGLWRGQLDVVDFLQGTTGNAPWYTANGISFSTGGAAWMGAAANLGTTSPAMFIGGNRVYGNADPDISTCVDYTAPNFGNNTAFAVVSSSQELSFVGGQITYLGGATSTFATTGLYFRSGVARYVRDGTSYDLDGGVNAGSVGARGGLYIGRGYGSSQGGIHGWVLANEEISADDIAKIIAWMEDLRA